MKKIFLTSGLMMCVVMPAMAVPTNTSNTFPNDELMQADYTYTNQATYNNMGVYSDSVDAEANYDWEYIIVPAGEYLPANSSVSRRCDNDYYCPGSSGQEQFHFDAQNDQGKIACSTLDNGAFPESFIRNVGASGCFRDCSVENMGNNGTVAMIPHATKIYGLDYYGGTENDTCIAIKCENGYHVDNGACVINTISINWDGATAAAISANNAGTTIYGGDIRTPQSVDSSSIPAGKRFVGWKFSKPGPFDLSTLDASINTTSDSEHTRWKPINGSDGTTMQQTFGTENSNDLSDGEWATTFSYGTVRGETLCSITKGAENYRTDTGNPESRIGTHCWCRATGYKASGSNEWQSVSGSDWVTEHKLVLPTGALNENTDYKLIGKNQIKDCFGTCAKQCANLFIQYADARRLLYGIPGEKVVVSDFD